jgi:hypothetical protein
MQAFFQSVLRFFPGKESASINTNQTGFQEVCAGLAATASGADVLPDVFEITP